jgi:hypothetical protein
MNNLITLLQMYDEEDQRDSNISSSSLLFERECDRTAAADLSIASTDSAAATSVISSVEVPQSLVPAFSPTEGNQAFRLKKKGVKKGSKRGPYKKKHEAQRTGLVLKEKKKQEKIDLSSTALEILQSHIVGIHPSTSMLAYMLENLMHWKRDFKHRLGPFKTWIKNQSHSSVQFHELGGPGKDFVSYRFNNNDSSTQPQTHSTSVKPIHDYSLDELCLHYSGLS